MQRQSKYAEAVPAILAEMKQRQEDDDKKHQPDQEEELPEKTFFVYPVEGGGIAFTDTPIEDETYPQSIVESKKPETDQRSTTRRHHPYFLHFLLLLVVFLLLDSADTMFATLLIPTVNITLTPQVKSVMLTSSLQLGKLLTPITLTESQTVPATGHGHQDASVATGSVTFYNGLFSQQFVASGTVFTGRDGVNVVTTQPAYIPAGNPSTGYGTVTVASQAQRPGQAGNIPAGDITSTITNGLLVKNNQFHSGQDTRDYKTVTKADTDGAAATLRAKVTASMTAALNGQLMPGEQIQPLPCTPTVTANHLPGDEAETVEVTVSQTCTAIAYDSQALTAQATRLLSIQATRKLGQGYVLSGTVQVTVTKATTQHNTVVLLFTSQAIYSYQLTAQAQQHIKALIAGKPRLSALSQLATLPGIQRVSINGITDNQPLPDDLTHIHLLLIVEG